MISNRKKQILLLIFSVFIILCTACTQKKSISGKEFVPRDQLVQILTDIHLMDGITNDIRFYRKYTSQDSIDLFTGILEEFDVDREKYERTIEEYSKYPELLDKVYDEVLMNLNLMLEEEEKKTDDQNKAPLRKSSG